MTHVKEERPWAQAWLRDDTLEALNRRIHGRDPVDKLYARARFLHESAMSLWPSALPREGSRMLDVGSGVGWPLQAGLDYFPASHITGLDISKPIAAQARKRLMNLAEAGDYQGRYEFIVYDGSNLPFADDTFDLVYSYRVLWHIPEHYLFPVLKEIARVVKPGGSVIVNFLPLQSMTVERMLAECEVQKNNAGTHYSYYHSYQKIHWWICRILGCTDFEIRSLDGRLWVHFTKGGATPVRNQRFTDLMERLEKQVSAAPGEARLAERNTQVGSLEATLAERDQQVAVLQATQGEHRDQIAALGATLAERDQHIGDIHRSNSWRITRPLRGLKMVLNAVAQAARRR
jgi:ubiquinone/menaquinone biosynthesis C-methylase UbiE